MASQNSGVVRDLVGEGVYKRHFRCSFILLIMNYSSNTPPSNKLLIFYDYIDSLINLGDKA